MAQHKSVNLALGVFFSSLLLLTIASFFFSLYVYDQLIFHWPIIFLASGFIAAFVSLFRAWRQLAELEATVSALSAKVDIMDRQLQNLKK